MWIFIIVGLLDLILLIHYFVYKREYNDAFKDSPRGDLVSKERSMKEFDGNRSYGIIVFFFLWFGIAIGITFILYQYSLKYYHDIGNTMHLKGLYTFYLLPVTFSCIFIVGNIFESVRNKIKLVYTQVDGSTILFSKKYDKFYLIKYPLFVLIEIIVITITGIICFFIMNNYIYSTSESIVYNDLFSIQEVTYLYEDMEEIEVEFYLNDDSLALKYILHFENNKILIDNYFPIDSSIEDELYMHQRIINTLQTNTGIVLSYTPLENDIFNRKLSKMNNTYRVLLQQIKDDYEAALN